MDCIDGSRLGCVDYLSEFEQEIFPELFIALRQEDL